jgi:hypothetical protein
MLPFPPSLRSIDRSFLLPAASPCRVPLPAGRVVEWSDVEASICGARIASSACVRITQDACARKLSNGFASDTQDRAHRVRDARRRAASDRRGEASSRAAPAIAGAARGRDQPRAAIGVTGRCAAPV